MDISKLYIDEATREKVSDVFTEIKNEFEGTSDRGAAIVAVSMLDLMLEDLIKGFLVNFKGNKEYKNIFSGNGPLSSFSNKIDMAFYMGLISEEERTKLNNIRNIRNLFAHQLNGINFNSESVTGKCNNLIFPDELLVPMDLEDSIDKKLIIHKPKQDDYRKIFQQAAYILITMISARKSNVIFDKRITPDNFTHRIQFSEASIVIQETMMAIAQDTIERKDELQLTEDQFEKCRILASQIKEKIEFHKAELELITQAIIVQDS